MNNHNESHSKFRNQVKPFLEGYIEMLLGELEKEKIIKVSKIQETGETIYQFQSDGIVDSTTSGTSKKSNIELLFELKEIASSIYYHLGLQNNDHTREMKFVQLMMKFEEIGAISIPWKTSKKLIDTLNNLNVLSKEDNLYAEAEKTIKESKINPTGILNQLLEYYGREKAKNFFLDYGFIENKNGRGTDAAFDLLLDSNKENAPSLLFEFKFRRNHFVPGKKMLLQSIKNLADFSNGKKMPYFFLVIFTTQERARFEKEIFLFNKLLSEDKELEKYADKVIFYPVSIKYLNLINDDFADFKNKIIEQDVRFNFRDQTPSKQHPNRNDHYYTETFDFRKNSFKIKIIPVNTPFWRFGFRFSPTATFPSINEPRHTNENKVVDVHIAIGDLDDNLKWVHPERLYFTCYEKENENLKNTFRELSNYNSKPLFMIMHSNDDGSMVEIEVRTEHESLGSRVLNLSKFQTCQFGAWCDYDHFNLDTEIKVTRKGAYYLEKH